MRIERIRSVADALKWVVDQIAHAAVVVVVFAPAAAWGLSTWTILLGGAVGLTLREIEQRSKKSSYAKAKQDLEPFFIRHVDRVLDVAVGAVAGTAILSRWVS